jgi:glutathione S-transferase
MSVTISGFARSPDRGRGLARDMRVRWALEEVGQLYDVRLLSFDGLKEPEHLERNPFGQIPTLEDGPLVLFESGAIILHIAQRWPGLLPADEAEKARAVSWMFAAVSTVEPPILDRSFMTLLESDKSWYRERLDEADGRIRARLSQLSRHLGERHWLQDAFGAPDIMMVHVLQRLNGSGLIEEFPNLARYIARAEGRPAYQSAFAAQLAVFTAGSAN